jgi:hypothetical protein
MVFQAVSVCERRIAFQAVSVCERRIAFQAVGFFAMSG